MPALRYEGQGPTVASIPRWSDPGSRTSRVDRAPLSGTKRWSIRRESSRQIPYRYVLAAHHPVRIASRIEPLAPVAVGAVRQVEVAGDDHGIGFGVDRGEQLLHRLALLGERRLVQRVGQVDGVDHEA